MAAEQRTDVTEKRTGRVLATFIGVVLAAGSLGALALTDDPQWLRLAIVAALWAFLIVAITGRFKRQDVIETSDNEDEIKRFYQLELDQEISARREYELRLEVQLRRELDAARSADFERLRADLEQLRTELSGASKGHRVPALSASQSSLDPLTATFISESYPDAVPGQLMTSQERIGNNRSSQRSFLTNSASESTERPLNERSVERAASSPERHRMLNAGAGQPQTRQRRNVSTPTTHTSQDSLTAATPTPSLQDAFTARKRATNGSLQSGSLHREPRNDQIVVHGSVDEPSTETGRHHRLEEDPQRRGRHEGNDVLSRILGRWNSG